MSKVDSAIRSRYGVWAYEGIDNYLADNGFPTIKKGRTPLERLVIAAVEFYEAEVAPPERTMTEEEDC